MVCVYEGKEVAAGCINGNKYVASPWCVHEGKDVADGCMNGNKYVASPWCVYGERAPRGKWNLWAEPRFRNRDQRSSGVRRENSIPQSCSRSPEPKAFEVQSNIKVSTWEKSQQPWYERPKHSKKRTFLELNFRIYVRSALFLTLLSVCLI